jgi:hypothetical protein
MKLVWAMLGAGALALLYSLALYRRRFRSQRSWARERLSSRMAAVEGRSRFDSSRDDAESARSFIEQVCVFSMSLTDRFWNETLQATAQEMAFIHEHGAFLSTVKIERGQRHVIVTIAEVLPESRSAEWHIRSFELFPGSSSLTRGGVILWELRTADPGDARSGSAGYRGLELRFEQNSLALSIRDYPPASEVRLEDPHRRLIARVPLDLRLLSRFRVPDETADPLSPEATAKTQVRFPADAPFISFFEHTDTEVGLIWHICRQEFVPSEASARSRTLDADEVRHRA